MYSTTERNYRWNRTKFWWMSCPKFHWCFPPWNEEEKWSFIYGNE